MGLTRAFLRTQLGRRITSRTDVTNTDIDQWGDDGLMDLCTQRIEIRSLQGVGSPLTTVIGAASVSRPTGVFSVRFLEDTTNQQVLTRFPGGMYEFLQGKQHSAGGPPTQFLEDGPSLFLLPVPDGVYTFTPYTYNYPTWGADASAEPSIEREWHYGVLLLAEAHAFRDLGDEERANAIDGQGGEFERWLMRRDTAIRRTRRHDIPIRTLRPEVARRNSRFGV